MSPSVDIARRLSSDLKLKPLLLAKSGSQYYEEPDTSALTSASRLSPSGSFTKSPSASYYKEYLRNITLADCRLTRRGTVITAEWTTPQGIVQQSSLNLDFHVGNIDGTLRWGWKDFSKSSTKWNLRGTILYASCRRRNNWGQEGSSYSELDLNQCIYVSGGVLCAIAHVDFSNLMSEASWMNIKVVAEPDMGKLFSHPAFRSSVSGIAERAVGHVMEKTQNVLQAIINEALGVIQENAKEYIESEIKTIMYTTYLHKSQSEHSQLQAFGDEDDLRSPVHKVGPRRPRYSAMNGAAEDGLWSLEHSRRNSDSSSTSTGELESMQYDYQVADVSTDGSLAQTVVELEGGANTEVVKGKQCQGCDNPECDVNTREYITNTREYNTNSKEYNTNTREYNTSSGECNTSSGECNTSSGECNTSSGECNTSSGECNTNTGECNTGSGECVTSTGECNTSSGECNTSSGECNTSTGECNTSSGECNTSSGECNTSTGECNTNTGECNTSSGECDTSSGECNTSSGECNTSSGECNTSTGECNTEGNTEECNTECNDEVVKEHECQVCSH